MGMPPGGGIPGAAPQSPMLQTVMGALANRAGAGGGPGAELSKQQADLQGADPSMTLRQLQQIKEAMGVLFIKTFQTLPNVAGHISKTMTTLDRAIKEAMQASQVGEVVGKTEEANQPPGINFTPAMGGQNAPGSQPAT